MLFLFTVLSGHIAVGIPVLESELYKIQLRFENWSPFEAITTQLNKGQICVQISPGGWLILQQSTGSRVRMCSWEVIKSWTVSTFLGFKQILQKNIEHPRLICGKSSWSHGFKMETPMGERGNIPALLVAPTSAGRKTAALQGRKINGTTCINIWQNHV